MPGPGRPRKHPNSREATRLRVARHRSNQQGTDTGTTLSFHTVLLAHDPRILPQLPTVDADNLAPLDELQNALDAIPINRESYINPRPRSTRGEEARSDDTIDVPDDISDPQQPHTLDGNVEPVHNVGSNSIPDLMSRSGTAPNLDFHPDMDHDFDDAMNDPGNSDNDSNEGHSPILDSFRPGPPTPPGQISISSYLFGLTSYDSLVITTIEREPAPEHTAELPPHANLGQEPSLEHRPGSLPNANPKPQSMDVVDTDRDDPPIPLAEALVEQLIRPYTCAADHGARTIPDSPNHPLPLSFFTAQPCYDVLGSPTIAQYPTEWQELVPPAERRRLYTGLTTKISNRTLPSAQDHPTIELETDTVSDHGSLQTLIDIDSAGGLASSLAVARAGFNWKAGRAAVSNLQSSLHLSQIPVSYEEAGKIKHTMRPIHQIPHLPFGNLVGFQEIEVYVLFPRLYQAGQKHWVITKEEYTTWTNRILFPAIQAVYASGPLQHLPASAAQIALNGTAVPMEGRVLPGVALPRTQDFHHTLAPSGLAPLWTDILERIEQGGLHQFQQCQLVLTAKNLKLATQRRTWCEAREAFFTRWNRAVNIAYLQQDFYDLAKEMVSVRSTSSLDPASDVALTMAWRRCCLEGFSERLTDLNKQLADGSSTVPSPSSPPRRTRRSHSAHAISNPRRNNSPDPTVDASLEVDPDTEDLSTDSEQGDQDYHPSSSSDELSNDEATSPPQRRSTPMLKERFYPQHGLRDQGSLTLAPHPKSALWTGGLRYCQLYNTTKEIFAAGKQYPFQNAQLDTIGIDPGMVRTWQHVGGAISHSPLAVLQAYTHTKQRCHVSLRDCRHRSYGTREEYRVTGALLQAMDRLLLQHGLGEAPLPPPPHPRPFYTHPTSLVFDWIRWNINKLCLGFEMTYSLQPRTIVLWEHTRVMMMFLQCLRVCYGGQGHHLDRCVGLRIDQRANPKPNSDTDGIQEGMGIQERLAQTGYMWFADKIDWTSMTFQPPHRAHMVFNTPTLQSSYHERYWRVVDAKSDFLQFHDVFTHLQQNPGDFRQASLLLQGLINLCLRAFRKDVFQVLSSSTTYQPLQDQLLSKACAGELPLTQSSLRQVFHHKIFQDDIHFVNSSQMAVKALDMLFARLWGWDGDGQQGDWPRRHWEFKPYRILFRQCFGVVAQIHGVQQAREWRTRLLQTWIRTHWILPYPDDTTFWPRHKDRRFKTWVSIHPGLDQYYGRNPNLPTLITPGQVDYLPVTGWQNGDKPSKLDIQLPPIPTDLDAWLDSMGEPTAVAALELPLPASDMQDGPIRRYLQEIAPDRVAVRSFMRTQALSDHRLHTNNQWLTQHLQDHLQATVDHLRTEIKHHQAPVATRQWQQRPRPALADGLAQLDITVHQVEDEDSDPDGLTTKQRRRIRQLEKSYRHLRLVRRDAEILIACNNHMDETQRLAAQPQRSMSTEKWKKRADAWPAVRTLKHQSKIRLNRVSRQTVRSM